MPTGCPRSGNRPFIVRAARATRLLLSGSAPPDTPVALIDGFELAARLRQQEGWDAVQFVALTGYGRQLDRERTQGAGFAAHLVKPADAREVDAVVRRLCRVASDPTSPRGDPSAGDRPDVVDLASGDYVIEVTQTEARRAVAFRIVP